MISALRAYYTTLIVFEDFTDSRTFLDIFSSIEPATSIIVTSSLVYGPVIKKWLHPTGPFSKRSASKPTTHSFRRIHDDTEEGLSGGLELEQTRTSIRGGEEHHPQNHKPQAADGITIQRDFSVQ